MTNLEHYFENLLYYGEDIKGEANKNALTEEQQKSVEQCAQYVIYSLFGTREHFDEWINREPASQWHRVEDELPEPIHPTDPRYKAYLICDSLGYMHVADYTYSKHFPTCYSFHVNGEEETDVKYWMPIEPPQETDDAN